MKRHAIGLLYTILFFLFVCSSVWAQPVNIQEARIIAENWIKIIVEKKGSWGAFSDAHITDGQEFLRKGQSVGYFFKVEPVGYIIVSPRKEMAPVKAYSARSNLDPTSEEGMADLLKGKLERIQEKVLQIARERKKITGKEVADTLEIDYRPVWEKIMSDPKGFLKDAQGMTGEASGDADTGGESANYQEGDVLLSSDWHQRPPYNNDCPYMACSSTSNGRAFVGCVATAAAQIMYYWAWPPYGIGSPYNDIYDWPNMRDSVTTSSPPAQQAAVAELSHEIGQAVGMSYGCDGSSADTYDMEEVFENQYRYGDVQRKKRRRFTAIEWFNIMKEEFNNNRPVQYRITDHSIVGDGWQEIGSPVVRQYHMNYGWVGTGDDTWYTLDTLTSDPEGEEYMLKNIHPNPYMSSLTGVFPRESFPYRYFTQDISGGPGTFAGGQKIQFLPGIVVQCTSGTVQFSNSASYDSHLFTKGDLSLGVRMQASAYVATIKLHPSGSIKFTK